MRRDVVPFVFRQEQFYKEIGHEYQAYPELPFLKLRLFIKLYTLECVDRYHHYQKH